MDKGVIVYICDSQGVRDIYEADGADTIVASEPLLKERTDRRAQLIFTRMIAFSHHSAFLI